RALQMAELTLDKMGRGGIYDQIGGGFHRYAVDAVWLVPHFEKMLYDNAQLAHAYTIAHQVTDEPFYRTIATETIEYVLREMTSPEGGFYSTQDADTEGHEGKFYVWTAAELRETLGDDDGNAVAELLGATERGNFEGSNVLSIPNVERRTEWRSQPFASLRRRLYDARSQRTWPGRDEKVLTSWNGMMLRAIATAAWVFDDDRYTDAAVANARFVRDHLLVEGRLLRSWKDGEAKLNGYLEDYANFIDGLLALYGATFDTDWIVLAAALARTMIDEFHDGGGFFDTGRSHEELVTRPRDAYDNATPSGNSVACDVLLRLAHLTGEQELVRIASDILGGYARHASESAHGFSRLLSAIDTALGPAAEIVVVGDQRDTGTTELLDALRSEYLPRAFVAVGTPGGSDAEIVSALHGRRMLNGGATAYVCVNQTCQLPVTDSTAMLEQVRAATRTTGR
ncbi:MAG TPA: thioredoxin domain-containing protein, partial [Thermomicrobiales bacterium]|nr:thioredoxin domain-containing protein [Thermomicrobiales bacterium]